MVTLNEYILLNIAPLLIDEPSEKGAVVELLSIKLALPIDSVFLFYEKFSL
jgi:hypothetical protein